MSDSGKTLHPYWLIPLKKYLVENVLVLSLLPDFDFFFLLFLFTLSSPLLLIEIGLNIVQVSLQIAMQTRMAFNLVLHPLTS